MAFKKPFHDVKTSAPLRSSDRRKLKQRVVETFSLEPETGDLLVPDPILSLKFNTHLDEPGIRQSVAYLSAEGDPLWFTLGKVSNDLIPTVYTLWKRPNLLPTLTTPSAVIPVLMGGADLMIPGVVRYPLHVTRTNLVAVTRYISDVSLAAPPLAVGRMAVDASELNETGKGKAVYVLHTFGDNLWEMGSKAEPPEPREIAAPSGESEVDNKGGKEEPASADNEGIGIAEDSERKKSTESNTAAEGEGEATVLTLSSEEVTTILKTSVIQAIHSQLSKLPPSAFPIPSSTLYSMYVLPSRPLWSVNTATPIDIKHSTFKNLTAFLKSVEKDGLLKLKDFKGDLNILGVNPTHKEVKSHKTYRTVGDKEKQEEKKSTREKAEKGKVKDIVVRELWKPHAQSVRFFEEIGKSPKDLYSYSDIRTIINEYTASRSLVNPNDQQYINVDELLLSVLTSPKSDEDIQYIKRDEAVKRLVDRMQNWHEILLDGKDPILRKGQLKPISVVVKVRQGRKASTLVTGFETFLISPEFLSDELKRICATSTSISPIPGKGNAGMEVLVQGKQIKAVTDFLISQGVPKKWIESSEKK
ncbi:hypothetical protein M422DRAFT_34849 [Sphaerobolus stellatus SS14]|uniref:Uncharacterized protein n=1 Tax=Sphaerobolus stellatus (strain SS14) TaxID=990650 RepID=A0A0C9TX01_SPHS4|nr:hypothetical protein M422DRAFT_34849 [Sphaerobolus stellatus SS14]